MQPSKNKIALLTGALILGASSAANAVTEPFNITAKALPDVVITTVTPLNFNTSIFITAGGSCLMNATTPGDASTALMQYDGATIAAANYGALTGDGCVNGIAGTGTPGVYRVAGLEGSAIKITINNSATGGDVEFSPNSGCIVTYEGGTVADTCDSFVPGVLANKKLALANANESPVTGSGVGLTTAGQMMFTVGGTLSVINELAPNFASTIAYNVEVVY
jgi:hypothetical protein